MNTAKTILIIDDDADDRSLFAEALSVADDSFTCIEANSSIKAIELLQQITFLPHFIFLDINLPSMNGWQCLKHLRNIEKFKAVPIIIYTTSMPCEDEDKAMRLGAAYLLIKPIRFKEIVQAIGNVLTKNWKEVP